MENKPDFIGGQMPLNNQGESALSVYFAREQKKQSRRLIEVAEAKKIIIQFGLQNFSRRNDLLQAASVIIRVNNDIEKRSLAKALSRLEGALKYSPMNCIFHDLAGKIYLEVDDKINAGKHFYLKENNSALELESVIAFEKSLGSDSVLILRKIYKRGTVMRNLDYYAQKRMKMLIVSINEQHSFIPRFALGIKRYFDAL